MVDRPGVPNIYGTNDSDNNSFSFFPVWRSQINGTTDKELSGLSSGEAMAGSYLILVEH